MEVSSVSHCPIVSDAWPQAELKSMSWDKLTGLADRQHLLYHLQNRLDSGLLPVSVMLFNIDDFRTINWRVGHRVGDRFLCAIARRLQARRSSQCRVGRFGADEFLLIKQDTSLDADQVFTRAREIASALSKPVAVAGQVLSRAVSTGASSSHGRQVDAESLVSEAELQLRRARQSARHLPKQRLRNNADTLDLERAIEAGKQIEVHYQPEVNLHTGKVAGVEALVRWAHPRRGLQAAGRFIGLAERSGLVVPLSWLVLHRALHQTAIWQQRQQIENFTLRVNASPLQVMAPGFAREVLQALDLHNLCPTLLCIEVTEHQVMHCKSVAVAELQQLRSKGVRIAIDDFGVGYSSLSRLKELPVDCLKIDRCFIQACHREKRERALIDSIMHLALAFELDVVAEGIKNDEELAFLRSRGVGLGQGERFALACNAECCESFFQQSFYQTKAALV